ncbi:MAG: ATP-binding protein [Treponema sp.]|jgi:predicted AAA+ superfamily ATPase|nr:ATP-binding protein [Treponema sp.]
MERKLSALLKEWKNRDGRMPLIIYGARQVGKTFTVLEFGRTEYERCLHINFENNRRAASLFEDDISPKRLVSLLEGMYGQTISPGKTLVFFDEIQSCERALTSLKYFREESPEYHIIAAGSLPGLALNREKYSFPVGNVESLTLYPMDFQEFLMALGRDMLVPEIRSCYAEDRKMPEGLHRELLELYRLYLITGGMPKVVKEYANTKKLVNLLSIQNEILDNYIADMSKYALAAETVRIKACYDSIPVQLAKENRKFQYKTVKSGGSAAIFGVSIEWLSLSGLVLKCQKCNSAAIPLAAYTNQGAFKLYMGDTGLLIAKSNFPYELLLSGLETDNTFLGAIAENYTACALAASGHALYYWESDNTAEVDFVIQKGAAAIPVEVKAGVHVKSRSLSVFREKYGNEYAIRISAKNFGFENNIKSVPLYAAFCV